jgi:hypothetical protein
MDTTINLENLDMSIVIGNLPQLLDQLASVPMTYDIITRKRVESRHMLDEVELELEVLASKIGKDLRISDPKISEAKISRILYEDTNYIEKLTLINQLRHIDSKLMAALKAVELRNENLRTIVSYFKQELRQLS